MALEPSATVSGILPVFQAFVSPAIFVSASALLLLSLNTRLMGMVSRLRQYLHQKHAALREGRLGEAEAYASQIESIERRAEMIRRAFVLALLSLTGTIASCLLLGAGLYFAQAGLAAVSVFIISILALLLASVYYLQEVRVALTSVREEASDSRFMDLAYAASDSPDAQDAARPESSAAHRLSA